MSTIINDEMRSIADLAKLTSYSEMTDEEINRIIEYNIQCALNEKKLEAQNETFSNNMSDLIALERQVCASNLNALQYMCERKTDAPTIEITKLEFHPMEFSNE